MNEKEQNKHYDKNVLNDDNIDAYNIVEATGAMQEFRDVLQTNVNEENLHHLVDRMNVD